jgi:hypothetical protein
MGHEIELLKIVCERLNQINVPYMLTGSLAAHFYAVPRMTRDIDIVVEILDPKVNKLFQAFKNGFYIDKRSIEEAIKYESMFNAIHEYSCFKIDFIIRKNSSYRSVEFQRRRQLELDGVKIWIVASEDLIISKLDWAKDSLSEMQIKDVRNLMSTVNNLDVLYIEKWVQSLNLDEIYKKVKTA